MLETLTHMLAAWGETRVPTGIPLLWVRLRLKRAQIWAMEQQGDARLKASAVPVGLARKIPQVVEAEVVVTQAMAPL